MAQAAFSRPSLQLSWSCVGPRRRSTSFNSSDKRDDDSESSTTSRDASEPFMVSPEGISSSTGMELPVSSSMGMTWDSESEHSCTTESNLHNNLGHDFEENEDAMAPREQQDHMTEVQMWQKLEQELYDEDGGETGTAKEIREEEAAAIAEVGENSTEDSVPNTKEVHRFFPPGRIMHIVTLVSDESSSENESNSSDDMDHSSPEDSEVGIFLTPRSLYSKIRLSQTMISDHFMPVYRRRIEKLIRVLEDNETCNSPHIRETAKKEISDTRYPTKEALHKVL